ncbi:MAG: cupin [Gammaproteobacteria bacterium]|nr:cupin [Gammaproteobacteria bacterium]
MNSQLTIYNEQTEVQQQLSDSSSIQTALDKVGVIYERWSASTPLAADADQDAVLAAYASDIETLNQRFGFNTIDVVSMQADNPKKDEFRQMFLSEHTHADFEVRFFVDGQGLFYLRPQETAPGAVYALHCTAGDLVSVPAGMTHWFDMGDKPNFKAIRFFTTDEGWVADFTGDDIASRFPLLSC